ncbi:MAG TPA: DUF3501 family protein [Candidatus Binataceae bacterium]|jgi:hypothetical protein|nr:DUF3501 family protein [Candidatus Binataceae bacterium]
MKPVQMAQILPYELYEKLRPLLRPLFIAEKDRRRLTIGEHVTLLFENAQTVWYQVQEMLRSERISSEEGIAHELDTYNELLPGPNELAATMMIQFTDAAQRDENLRKLAGLENQIYLRISDRRQKARVDLRQVSDERVSSVQFVRFALGGIDAEGFATKARQGQISVEIEHPAMTMSAPITDTLAAVLVEDLIQS